jgi:hypothetical protein
MESFLNPGPPAGLQNPAAVAITGGTIDGTTLGASVPAAAAVTTLKVTTGAAANSTLISDADGNLSYLKNNLGATTNPAVTDDSAAGYSALSLWLNTSTTEIYRCLSAAVGAAVWEQTTLTLDDLGSMATQAANAVDITGGTINGATIGGVTPGAVTATTSTATTFDTGVLAAGVTLVGTTLSADGTDSNINIAITPKGTGEVDITKIDCDGGAIDGTTIGATTPAAGTFTTLSAFAANLAAPAIGARYNAANARLSFNVANNNGWPYLAYNATPKQTSDACTYDLGGVFSSKLEFHAGLVFSGAAAGTAGADIAWTEMFRVSTTGNVGIGTNDPQRTLHIRAANNNVCEFVMATEFGTANKKIWRLQANNGDFTIGSVLDNWTAGTEMMRITSGGNVLVGTTTEPATAARLVVQGSTADGSTNCLTLQNSAGTAVMIVNTDGKIVAANLDGCVIGATTPAAATFTTLAAKAIAYDVSQAGGLTVSSTGGQLVGRFALRTSDAGAPRISLDYPINGEGGLAEGLTISQSGNVGIGTTTDSSVLLKLGDDANAYGAAKGILWGTDTNLYRSAANTLKTDDSLHVGTDFRHLGSNLGFFNVAAAAQRTHVADPSGGTTVDAEARSAINAILATLETYGLHAAS